MAHPYPPISDYALLSDCHSGALVSTDGSIDWCAFHRFEARPVFGRLVIPIVGLVAFDDPRATATIELVAKELGADGYVRCYVTDGMDGVGGDAGAFFICSFWLVECLARGGEQDRARGLFERLLSHCNDLGLLSEEVDPASRELLGNFPQAYSHLGPTRPQSPSTCPRA
jgi:GH15 family glucan-1,4-alpha-glucosidase